MTKFFDLSISKHLVGDQFIFPKHSLCISLVVFSACEVSESTLTLLFTCEVFHM